MQLTEYWREMWEEKAGRLGYDEEMEGEAADRHALFAVYDEQSRRDNADSM